MPTARHGGRSVGGFGGTQRAQKAEPSAPGVAGVRVREVMSRGPGPRTRAPPPEGVDVGYPLGLPGDRLLAAEMRLLTLAFFITPRDFSFPVYAQG